MSEEPMLPAGFTALEPFAQTWAIEDTASRAAMRSASEPEQREAFFAAASPLLDVALDYLDGRPLAALSNADRRLMNVMLSLAHVALAVEIQGPDEVKSATWRDRMQITRSTADQRVAA